VDRSWRQARFFGLRGGYNFTGHWGAEALFSYVLTESNPTNRETDVYRYGVDILYHFMPERQFVPFIAAGYGASLLHNPGLRDDSTGLFNYGLGLKYFVADWVALRGDMRHLVIPSGSQKIWNTRPD